MTTAPFSAVLRRNIYVSAFAGLALLGGLAAGGQTAAATPPSNASGSTFTNPLLHNGPDPWVVWWKGFYYYSNSTGSNLTLRKTADITDLEHAETKVVWAPQGEHPWSHDLWAPEMHRWGDKWYIYFAADAGENASHRIYVVENPSDDPTEGSWTLKGKVSDATDKWAIDATEFEAHGEHYLAWAGWPGDQDGEQDLYVAHLSNPWTIDSPRTMVSRPTYAWETHGDLPGRHVSVNEGPEFLQHGDKMFIVFSASGCWTDFYTLGAVEADAKKDPSKAKTWKKIDHPLLSTDPDAPAYGPGHNGFFQSPDGTQDWIIYHANPEPGQGCGNHRSPRIQRFTWKADGTPDFGKPATLGVPMAKPRQ